MKTANDSSLSDLQSFQVSSPAITTNNAALVYYEDSSYALAGIAKYLATFLAISAVLFIFAGLFGGRLISL
jgi:hypothetical protein